MAWLLAACGKNPPPDESQIAAHVNKGEISVHQVQAALLRQARLSGDAAGSSTDRVLEVLIDQELAAQAAVSQGLGSDAGVIQSIQLARREAMAHAYFDRVAAKTALPSSDDVDKYYDEHPELFAQRRLYVIQEYAMEVDADRLSLLRKAIERSTGADALAVALRTAGFKYSTRSYANSAEDIPLHLLQELSGLGEGASVYVTQPGGARIYQLMSATSSPVSRAAARDPIVRYLVAERKRVAVIEAMKALRQGALIGYVGTFAKAAAKPAAPGSPASGPR